jgi:hypothetical protein
MDEKNSRLKIVGELVNGRPQALTTNLVPSWLRVEMTVLFSVSFHILHQNLRSIHFRCEHTSQSHRTSWKFPTYVMKGENG